MPVRAFDATALETCVTSHLSTSLRRWLRCCFRAGRSKPAKVPPIGMIVLRPMANRPEQVYCRGLERWVREESAASWGCACVSIAVVEARRVYLSLEKSRATWNNSTSVGDSVLTALSVRLFDWPVYVNFCVPCLMGDVKRSTTSSPWRQQPLEESVDAESRRNPREKVGG